MSVSYNTMAETDWSDAHALWTASDGVCVHDDLDSLESVTYYLRRNPGMSFVAREDGKLIGAVLCGTDGRRGYLHHLAVDPDARGKGVGRRLAARCMQALSEAGIRKCHIFVLEENIPGKEFWRRAGWDRRDDVAIFSRMTGQA
ncbi:MAG: GNAT family N-acetyltransferase [Phycisphaerae bacterium]